jgi:hypothetical protein
MGLALYVTLERGVPGLELLMGGKHLARAQPVLDGFAKRNGLTSLEAVYSCSPEEEADAMEFHGGNPAEFSIPPEQWFDAIDGLRTVRALLPFVRENPARFQDANGVLGDLEDMEQILAAAEKHGVRFHMAYDF